MIKKRPPRAVYETLIEGYGRVYAVTFRNGEPVLRTAGQMNWCKHESQFCPMRINANGDICEDDAAIVRRRPSLECVTVNREYKQSWHEHIWTWLAEAETANRIERRVDALI